MVAQQQHDAEHRPEAVPRGALFQLQKSVVLGHKGDRLRPEGLGFPGPTLRTREGWGPGGHWRCCCSGGGRVLDPGGWGSAAPRLCTPGQEAAPLSATATILDGGYSCQGQGKGLGPVLPTSTALPPCLMYSPFWPTVGAEALSSPRSGRGRRRRILTTGSGHRRDPEDCGLGRLPGGEGSRAWLGRSERPGPTVSLPVDCLCLPPKARLFCVTYRYDLPQPCLYPGRVGRRMETALVLEVSPLRPRPRTVPPLSLSHALPSHHHPEILPVTQEPS